MSKLKTPVSLQTAFGEYELHDILGEGGAGRVYSGKSASGEAVAVKLLTAGSSDKRRRFKNEITFLARNQHANIVTVIDHGMAAGSDLAGPFYVMDRYSSNLRVVMSSPVSSAERLRLFALVLDGVEAAHLQKVVHRDLKPENVLYEVSTKALAVADFGVASFTTDHMATAVKTGAHQRLANFQYAAPEQRVGGKGVTDATDIYALGLILNEMFTGEVPHGTDYKLIASVSADHAYLDGIVSKMLKQNPAERPQSIALLKADIQKYAADAVSQQRLSKITQTVIPAGAIDDPLAHDPPKLVGAAWLNGTLELKLDRPVSESWLHALHNMGNFTAVMGIPPTSFRFIGATATVSCPEHSAQNVIDYLKQWLPMATALLKYNLENKAREAEARAKEELRRAREAEERNIRVNSNLKV